MILHEVTLVQKKILVSVILAEVNVQDFPFFQHLICCFPKKNICQFYFQRGDFQLIFLSRI